jgi:hypothetical protein
MPSLSCRLSSALTDSCLPGIIFSRIITIKRLETIKVAAIKRCDLVKHLINMIYSFYGSYDYYVISRIFEYLWIILSGFCIRSRDFLKLICPNFECFFLLDLPSILYIICNHEQDISRKRF